ncbi:hypothetical protein L6R29_20725 [Myxococcota bacterium]|nr:hypothetical protein [Myxococcota bacterium]
MSQKPHNHPPRPTGPFVEQSPQSHDDPHHAPLEQTVELQIDANHPLHARRKAHQSPAAPTDQETTVLLSRPNLSSPSSEALPAASSSVSPLPKATPDDTKPHPLPHRVQPPRHASPSSDALPAAASISSAPTPIPPSATSAAPSSPLASPSSSKKQSLSSFFTRKDGPMEMYLLLGGVGLLFFLVFVWAFFILVSMRSSSPQKPTDPRPTPAQQTQPAKISPAKTSPSK